MLGFGDHICISVFFPEEMAAFCNVLESVYTGLPYGKLVQNLASLLIENPGDTSLLLRYFCVKITLILAEGEYMPLKGVWLNN